MKKLAFILFLTLSPILTLKADLPFRNHRYNVFSVLPVLPDQIVMMGNSITNMHEWWEALGDHRIVNRGVSGAVSDEMVANMDPIVKGHPAKVFIMIGTNDIGYGQSREHIAENLQTILNRFKLESPITRVYVQSILPSGNGSRGGKIAGVNELLKTVCRKAGVTFIDLYNLLGDGEGHLKAGWSFDDLHPKAAGYQAWCNTLLPYLNEGMDYTFSCQYPQTFPDIHEGYTNSWGARMGALSLLPVKKDDIVFIGDEMIHSGEWHELLGSPRAKNRGTGWGYPGADMALIQKQISHFMHGNENSVCPQAVVLYAGAQEAENRMDIHNFEIKYRELLTTLHEQAPEAHIQVLTVLRNTDAEKDTLVQAYNKVLKTICKKDKKATLVDIYTPLCSPEMMMENYVSGSGYLKIAEILKCLL